VAGLGFPRWRGVERAKAITIAIIVLGALLRVWSTFAVPPSVLQGDEMFYWKRAALIHRTGDPGTALQAPGQSYVVALGRSITPDSPAGSRSLNLVAYLLAAWAVVALASRWSRAAIPIAVLSFHPVLIGFSAFLWSEVVFLPFLFWAVHLQQSRRMSVVAGAGVLWGLAALMRHIATPFFVIALLFEWRAIGRRTGRRSAPLFFVLAFGLTVSPWAIRNQVVLGAPVLSASSGFNLWVGNNDESGEPYPLKPKIPLLLRKWKGFAENELERDAEARKRAMQFIESEQPQWLVLKPWAGLKGLLRPDNFVLRTARRNLYGALSDPVHWIILVATLGGELLALAWTTWAISGCQMRRRRWMVATMWLAGFAVHLLTVAHPRHRIVLTVMGLLTAGTNAAPPTPRRRLLVAAVVVGAVVAGALSSSYPSFELLLGD